MSGHTKGPWEANLSDVPYEELGFECWTVDAPAGGICTVDCAKDEREANAAYIVRACNSFPELLEALEAVDRMFSEPGKWNKRTIADKVRAAIARAKDGAA